MSGGRAREATRHAYLPQQLRVLFIGESPPTDGTFFYDANSILFTATREAFTNAMPALAAETDFLQVFREAGCYLEDLSLLPIDKLPDGEKRRARTAAIPDLARRLTGMMPSEIVVVVKGILPHAKQALAEAGIHNVALHALPFPGQWWRSQYIDDLAARVKLWDRNGVLLPDPTD